MTGLTGYLSPTYSALLRFQFCFLLEKISVPGRGPFSKDLPMAQGIITHSIRCGTSYPHHKQFAHSLSSIRISRHGTLTLSSDLPFHYHTEKVNNSTHGLLVFHWDLTAPKLDSHSSTGPKGCNAVMQKDTSSRGLVSWVGSIDSVLHLAPHFLFLLFIFLFFPPSTKKKKILRMSRNRSPRYLLWSSIFTVSVTGQGLGSPHVSLTIRTRPSPEKYPSTVTPPNSIVPRIRLLPS